MLVKKRRQLREFRALWLIYGETQCRYCGTDLSREPLKHYDHSGGWTISGYDKKQWLYIECPKCRYQWALWKLGIPREGIWE